MSLITIWKLKIELLRQIELLKETEVVYILCALTLIIVIMIYILIHLLTTQHYIQEGQSNGTTPCQKT